MKSKELLEDAGSQQVEVETLAPEPPQQQEMPFAYVEGEPVTELPRDLYIPPDALQVFLEAFEGPLDLLLYLIRKQNLDILDIPISEITRQYMQYIEVMAELQLELAGEYLLMAAMLAEIKSRMLLPRVTTPEGEEEEDPRAELVRRLQEYERFKKAAEDIDQLPRADRDVLPASIELSERKVVKVLPQVTLRELLSAFKDVLSRAEMFAHHHIARERLSIRQRMTEILDNLRDNTFVEFTKLFRPEEGRMGVTVTFIAILELMKAGAIEIAQGAPFDPIHVRPASGPRKVAIDDSESAAADAENQAALAQPAQPDEDEEDEEGDLLDQLPDEPVSGDGDESVAAARSEPGEEIAPDAGEATAPTTPDAEDQELAGAAELSAQDEVGLSASETVAEQARAADAGEDVPAAADAASEEPALVATGVVSPSMSFIAESASDEPVATSEPEVQRELSSVADTDLASSDESPELTASDADVAGEHAVAGDAGDDFGAEYDFGDGEDGELDDFGDDNDDEDFEDDDEAFDDDDDFDEDDDDDGFEDEDDFEDEDASDDEFDDEEDDEADDLGASNSLDADDDGLVGAGEYAQQTALSVRSQDAGDPAAIAALGADGLTCDVPMGGAPVDQSGESMPASQVDGGDWNNEHLVGRDAALDASNVAPPPDEESPDSASAEVAAEAVDTPVDAGGEADPQPLGEAASATAGESDAQSFDPVANRDEQER